MPPATIIVRPQEGRPVVAPRHISTPDQLGGPSSGNHVAADVEWMPSAPTSASARSVSRLPSRRSTAACTPSGVSVKFRRGGGRSGSRRAELVRARARRSTPCSLPRWIQNCGASCPAARPRVCARMSRPSRALDKPLPSGTPTASSAGRRPTPPSSRIAWAACRCRRREFADLRGLFGDRRADAARMQREGEREPLGSRPPAIRSAASFPPSPLRPVARMARPAARVESADRGGSG